MLRIRDEQVNIFDEVVARNFEDRTLQYLKESFPKHCSEIGDAAVRQIVLDGWKRAKAYGITNGGGVQFFVSLIFLLGNEFDTDPLLPFLGDILRDQAISSQDDRLDRLFEKVTAYLDKVAGPENELVEAALRNAQREDLAMMIPGEGADFYRFAIARLHRLYPQKCEYIGELNLRRSIQRAIQSAERLGINSARGQALYVGLMFLLGSGFDHDPLFPWLRQVFQEEGSGREEKLIAELYKASMGYLEKWIG